MANGYECIGKCVSDDPWRTQCRQTTCDVSGTMSTAGGMPQLWGNQAKERKTALLRTTFWPSRYQWRRLAPVSVSAKKTGHGYPADGFTNPVLGRGPKRSAHGASLCVYSDPMSGLRTVDTRCLSRNGHFLTGIQMPNSQSDCQLVPRKPRLWKRLCVSIGTAFVEKNHIDPTTLSI